MLADIDLANLCQAQYDGESIFDHAVGYGGDYASVKLYPDCTVVVHEGSHNMPNWIDNIEFRMVQVPDFGGVEHGFYDNLPEMVETLLPLIPKEKPVYVTGHSRGAARAQIFAAILIKQGYRVVTVVFGSPRPGDAQLAKTLAQAPNRSYRNYRDFDEQDFVCDVPLPYPFGYVHPTTQIKLDVPPEKYDTWGILARHHLFLYTKGVAIYGKFDTGK